uniref:Uncharacterized protein n=1 Tax=Spironucleus salmonicida TaxID=348837 RepID=V6LPC6_9EUKA|eukprot:EST45566.1 Hypothetical protein SS50377_14496 [Spironucleus salmonicida]
MNCAQKVSEKVNPSLTNIVKYAGGGNAPSHVCGALYAVQLANPSVQPLLEEQFSKKFGGVECSELYGKISCDELVEYAVSLVK